MTLAGLKKLVARGKITSEERVVLILTGHTLKDPQYTIDYHRNALLTETEAAEASPAERLQHEALRRQPLVLDVEGDTVLRTVSRMVESGAAVSV